MSNSQLTAPPLLITRKVYLPKSMRALALILAASMFASVTALVFQARGAEVLTKALIYLFPLLFLLYFFISHHIEIYADRIRLHYFPFLRMTIKFDAITYWSMPAQTVELMGLSHRGIRILPQVGTRFANRSGQALSVHTSRPQRFQIVLASEQEAVEVGQLLGSLLPIPPGDLRNP